VVNASAAGQPSQTIEVSSELTQAQWDAFVERHPAGTVEHLWLWRDVFKKVFGHDSHYLAATRDSDVVGILPLVFVKSLLFGRSLVSLPFANYGGIITSDVDAAQALVARATDIARGFRATHIELRNIERTVQTLPCREHKVGARLALPATSEGLFAALDRKVRNQIRKAQKENVTVVEGGEELVSEFYRVLAHNMRDLGTPVFPKQLFVETVRGLPGGARVFVARHGTTTVAAAIALAWRDIVLVPWASSLREHRNLNGNMLLYWTMLEFAIARRCATFDFGRSTPGGGTHHFKQQWDATDFPLHWEYVMLNGQAVPDHSASSPRLQRVTEMWKRLPVPVATAVGPLISRHIF
jgi:FemAB-related protein (PEP-CTERM system-associated)